MCFWSLFCQFRVFVSEMSSDQVNKTMTLVHARKPKDKMRCRGCNQFKKPKQATEYYRRNSRNAIFRNCQRRVPQTRIKPEMVIELSCKRSADIHFTCISFRTLLSDARPVSFIADLDAITLTYVGSSTLNRRAVKWPAKYPAEFPCFNINCVFIKRCVSNVDALAGASDDAGHSADDDGAREKKYFCDDATCASADLNLNKCKFSFSVA